MVAGHMSIGLPKMDLKRFLGLVLGAVIALPAAATCPMFDSVKYQGQDLTIYQNTKFPESSAYTQWARTWGLCSAMNQGRAAYEIIEKSVVLVAFRACSSQRTPGEIYPGAADPLPAAWMEGEVQAFGGKSACLSGMCMVGATKFTFTLRDGVVVSVRDEPNPECRGAK